MPGSPALDARTLRNGSTGAELGIWLSSASLPVLVDEAANGIVAFKPSRWRGDDSGVVVRDELVSALVGPVV